MARTKSARQPTTMASRIISARIADCRLRQRPMPASALGAAREARRAAMLSISSSGSAASLGRHNSSIAASRQRRRCRLHGERSRSTGAIGGDSHLGGVSATRRLHPALAERRLESRPSPVDAEARPNRRRLADIKLLGRTGSSGPPGHGFGHGLDGAADRRQRIGRGNQPVGVRQFGVPDRTAADAAHPAAIRPQACHVDIVGCSAVRADDEHRANQGRGSFGGEPSSRSVNGLETKPRPASRHRQAVLS